MSRLRPDVSKSPFLQRTDSGQPWSQRKQRRGQMFRDQHGRRWFAMTELASGAPTGMIEPQFQAPLIPPQKYLELSTDPERPYDLSIAYDRWVQDTQTDRDEWFKNGRITARRLQGERYDAAKSFTAEVLDIIGPEPTPLEPILAAKAGNPWITGKTERPDRRLVQFFETPESERRTAQHTVDYSTLEALEEEYDPNAEGGKRVDPRADRPKRSHHKKRDPAPAGVE